MSISIEMVPFVASILPKRIIEKTDEKSIGSSSEHEDNRMLALVKLLIHLMKRTAKSFLNKEMMLFNANPGDHGCQLRALKLRQLSMSPALLQEAGALVVKVEKLIRNIGGYARKRTRYYMKDFFHQQIEPVMVSKDMLFLLRCFLLTLTKIPDPIQKDDLGYIFTILDPGQLSKLSKKIQRYFGESSLLIQFLEENKSALAKHSIEVVQEVAAEQKDPLCIEMLSDKHVRKIQVKQFSAKPFSCLFFQMQVFFQHLREQRVVVAIKRLCKDPQQLFYLFFQASKSGFQLLSDEEIKLFNPKILVVVFWGGTELSRDALAKKTAEVGFDRMMLLLAAQEPPYDRMTPSTLEDVSHSEARQLIQKYRDEAQGFGLSKKHQPFFQPRHIFCNTLGKELACNTLKV